MTETQWEYMIECANLVGDRNSDPDHDLYIRLTTLGKLGWELVAFYGSDESARMVLKRPL